LSPIMIRVSELCKTYRGLSFDNKESGIVMWFKHARQLTSNKANSIKALDSVSFHVEPGEILGIYGANGAGKTTLIKILSGLLEPDSGEVRLNGQNRQEQNQRSDQLYLYQWVDGFGVAVDGKGEISIFTVRYLA
jgi:ABC-type multidrug transport system ATPase subunit